MKLIAGDIDRGQASELSWGRLTYSRACDALGNPCYAGAYAFGRLRSRRAVTPDGRIVTKTVAVPRSEWPVLIADHHPGYITWNAYLTNERRLAANHTAKGQRPAREGSALCQGIVRCGACGRPMGTQYQRGSGDYECSRSRAEHLMTSGCRQVTARVVDELVTERLLAVLAPHEIALALATADDVEQRLKRSNRALELRVERARYDAVRAQRAFHACEPENRLVARSLETRWEETLRELQDAEAELAEHTTPAPEPSREQIEALARDVPALWAAKTTSDKDRKRLLRAMIADVTLTFAPDSDQLQVGIRWRSGAVEQHTITRPQRETVPEATLQLVARLAEDHSNTEIVAKLQAAGVRTPRGRPFDESNVKSLRCRYKIPSGPPRQDGELTGVASEECTTGSGIAEDGRGCGRWDTFLRCCSRCLQSRCYRGWRRRRGRWCDPRPGWWTTAHIGSAIPAVWSGSRVCRGRCAWR